jgi:hypothetical protein
VEGTPLHEELVSWFLTLPLFLDLPELRLVHACWHPAALAYLRPYLTVDNRLKIETMVEASREPEHEAEKDMPELTVFKAAEAVLKGIEVPRFEVFQRLTNPWGTPKTTEVVEDRTFCGSDCGSDIGVVNVAIACGQAYSRIRPKRAISF